MKSQGYVLIELLVASVLLSFAGTGLYTGVVEGLRAARVVRETNETYDPLRILWKRMEKDLRNSVYLKEQVYVGKQDEMMFPVITIEQGSDRHSFGLHKVRYYVKHHGLERSEQALSNKLVQEDPKERELLKGIDGINFQYAYLDDEEKLLFQPFWLEEPYFGIPKAVKIGVRWQGRLFSKLISIPQGRWGRIQPEDKPLHEN